MQCISVFLDITKSADFRRKNADASRNQGVCHLIHMFLKSSFAKVYKCHNAPPPIRKHPGKCPS